MRDSYRLFTPKYPYCIVQELPKAREEGTIILTDDDNKLIHEGVVLAVWEPFDKEVGHLKLEHMEMVEYYAKQVGLPDAPGPSYAFIKLAKEIMAMSTVKYARMESAFKPGDHVLYPHWASSSRRDPSETDVVFLNEVSELLGKINPDPVVSRKVILDVLTKMPCGMPELDASLTAEMLERALVLVPRLSVTSSGETYTEVGL